MRKVHRRKSQVTLREVSLTLGIQKLKEFLGIIYSDPISPQLMISKLGSTEVKWLAPSPDKRHRARVSER